MELVNLDKLYNIYIDENSRINTNKLLVLEHFREKENNFKKYEDIVSLLEKEKGESKIDSYAALSEEILTELKNFNPNSIEENLKPVKDQIDNIQIIKEDVSKVSDKFRFIENMWLSFLERKATMDKDSIFIRDIFQKISELKEEFSFISINDLGMIEEKIDTLKNSIVRAMSIIEDLTSIIEKNVFIGKEPKELHDKIKDFVEFKYKKMSLSDINLFSTDIDEEIERLRHYRITKRLKAKVIKLKNKQNQNIYNYGIELKGIMMYVSEKLSTNEVKEDTRKFLYIENFPIYGLFNIKTLNEEIEVADDQFFANKELNDKSLNLFIIVSIATLYVLSLDYTPIVKIPLAILMQFVFVFFFKGLMYRINDKYNLKNMFYFFKISYIYTSIGDTGLDVQKIIPNILLNFDNIVDNTVSLEQASEDNPQSNKYKEKNQKSKEDIVEEKVESKKSFFKSFLKKEVKKDLDGEKEKEKEKEIKKNKESIKDKFKKIIDTINEKDRLKKLKKEEKKND